MTSKMPRLAVYDYGQGGSWLLIDAHSAGDIESKYLKLRAFDDRPDWMSESEKAEYVRSCEAAGFHWDLDAPPTGWLKKLEESDE